MPDSNETKETPAPITGGGFRVPKVPGMAWCLTEDEPARRRCGAGNHQVILVEYITEEIQWGH